MAGNPNKQISVAFSVSVMGHAIMFGLLVVFIGIEFEQSITDRPLIIHIEDQEIQGNFTADQPEVSTPAAATPTPPTQAPQNTVAKQPAKTVARQLDPDRGERDTGDYSEDLTVAAVALPSPEKTAVEQVAKLEELPVDSTNVLATVQSREALVAPPQQGTAASIAKTVSMSARQETMLQKRVEKWARRAQKMASTDQDMTWEHKGQQYTAKLTRQPAKTDMDIEKVVIAISTMQNGKPVSTKMQMKRLAFSNFTQFVNHWDPDVHVHDDELDGRFHSNSEISLMATRDAMPRFRGKVTTASRQIHTQDSDEPIKRSNVFLGGLETGVKRIVIPNHFTPFPQNGAIDAGRTQYFDDHTVIRFYANGTYGFRTAGTNNPEQRRTLTDQTAYLIGEKRKKLYVSGIVKGKVLVYSPERIIITDDLIYAHDPETHPDGNNYLGLVSDKYMEIAGANVTGPGDLSIHASMYAKRRFAVRGYSAGDNALMHIFGSLTAGTISATEPRYRTRLQFDPRLESRRPPGFPVTNRFEVEPWDATWSPD